MRPVPRPVPRPAPVPVASSPVVVRVVRARVPAILARGLGLLAPRLSRSRVPGPKLLPGVPPLVRSVQSRIVRVVTEAVLAHGEVVSQPRAPEFLFRDEPLGLGPELMRDASLGTPAVPVLRGFHPLAVHLDEIALLRVLRSDVALGVVFRAAAAVQRVRIVERAVRPGCRIVAARTALEPGALLVDHRHEEPHLARASRLVWGFFLRRLLPPNEPNQRVCQLCRAIWARGRYSYGNRNLPRVSGRHKHRRTDPRGRYARRGRSSGLSSARSRHLTGCRDRRSRSGTKSPFGVRFV